MSQEIALRGYYQSLRDNNWVDSNNVCALGIEFFLSHLLFNKDLSRVVYSKDDIAFRRRAEMIGTGMTRDQFESKSYPYLSLDLPFAVYSMSGSFEADDRIASMNAAAAVKGHMQPDTGIILKNMPVKIKYTCTAFFGRRDDVNVASQLLYWEQNPKWPLYFIVHHQIAGQPLDIPVFMQIESVDSNVDYTEKKWLEESKIFPVKIELTVRTYQTLIETTSEVGHKLPLRWSGLYGYNTNNEVMFTQNSLLMFADDKWTPMALNNALKRDPSYLEKTWTEWDAISIGKPDLLDLANSGKLVPHSRGDDRGERVGVPETEEERQEKLDQHNVNKTVEEAVKGYFNEDPTPILLEFLVKDETDTNLTIRWVLNDTAASTFKRLTIYCPGVIHWFTESAVITEFVVNDLHPASTYDFTIVVSGQWGEKTYRLQATTTGSPIVGNNSRLAANLIGRTFTMRD